jgi:creatinine amidohydrolase/Fe(II)-dependent formamide hydrolase-like protein
LSDPSRTTLNELDGYGPFGKSEAEIVLFSIGNDCEAHGPALPKDIDSRVAKEVCLRLANVSGASYLAHIPFSTDMTGEIAKCWSPRYMPFKEFADKTLEFIRSYLSQLVYKPKKVVILNGHGGNTELITMIGKYGESLGVDVTVFLPDEVRMPVDYSGEHAYVIEHSVAAYLGILDVKRLEELNAVAERDPLEALRRWPSVAGLGGFQEFGGKKFSPLKAMLHECLAHFKSKRKIGADRKLGEQILTGMVNAIKEQI